MSKGLGTNAFGDIWTKNKDVLSLFWTLTTEHQLSTKTNRNTHQRFVLEMCHDLRQIVFKWPFIGFIYKVSGIKIRMRKRECWLKWWLKPSGSWAKNIWPWPLQHESRLHGLVSSLEISSMSFVLLLKPTPVRPWGGNLNFFSWCYAFFKISQKWPKLASRNTLMRVWWGVTECAYVWLLK